MKAAVMTTLRKIEIQERDIPAIKENEVLMNIKHVGIFGSFAQIRLKIIFRR